MGKKIIKKSIDAPNIVGPERVEKALNDYLCKLRNEHIVNIKNLKRSIYGNNFLTYVEKLESELPTFIKWYRNLYKEYLENSNAEEVKDSGSSESVSNYNALEQIVDIQNTLKEIKDKISENPESGDLLKKLTGFQEPLVTENKRLKEENLVLHQKLESALLVKEIANNALSEEIKELKVRLGIQENKNRHLNVIVGNLRAELKHKDNRILDLENSNRLLEAHLNNLILKSQHEYDEALASVEWFVKRGIFTENEISFVSNALEVDFETTKVLMNSIPITHKALDELLQVSRIDDLSVIADALKVIDKKLEKKAYVYTKYTRPYVLDQPSKEPTLIAFSQPKLLGECKHIHIVTGIDKRAIRTADKVLPFVKRNLEQLSASDCAQHILYDLDERFKPLVNDLVSVSETGLTLIQLLDNFTIFKDIEGKVKYKLQMSKFNKTPLNNDFVSVCLKYVDSFTEEDLMLIIKALDFKFPNLRSSIWVDVGIRPITRPPLTADKYFVQLVFRTKDGKVMFSNNLETLYLISECDYMYELEEIFQRHEGAVIEMEVNSKTESPTGETKVKVEIEKVFREFTLLKPILRKDVADV